MNANPTPQAQLKTLGADLHNLDQNLERVAKDITPDGTHLSTQLRGGIGVVRRDLLADATETLAVLVQLDEEAAARRHLETTDLLAAVAALGCDARHLLLDRPEAIARYLHARYGQGDQMVMGALYLDASNRLISNEEIFRGTLERTAVEPRTILRLALSHSAASLILWQARPSGDPRPSPHDANFARRVEDAAKIVGVRVHDHLILGKGGRWLSLQRKRRKGKDDGQA